MKSRIALELLTEQIWGNMLLANNWDGIPDGIKHLIAQHFIWYSHGCEYYGLWDISTREYAQNLLTTKHYKDRLNTINISRRSVVVFDQIPNLLRQ